MIFRQRLALRSLVLLLATTVTTCRHLTQTQSNASSSGGNYADQLLDALYGNASSSGPILYKTFEAAYYALQAEGGDASTVSLVNSSQIVTFGNESKALLAWDAGNRSLILAFSASQTDNSSLTASVTSLAPVEFLRDAFNGNPPSANPAALTPFASLLGNITAENGAINNVTNGASNSSINRVLCTGHSGAAAWAQLCGPWAQVTYPAAHTRVITFGGPKVGGEKFNWATQRFVDLPYLWLTSEDNRTIGQQPSGSNLVQLNITRVIPQANYSGQGQNSSIEYYVTLLNNTLKANQSAIPVTLQTNYSYGYLPGGFDTGFEASSAPQGGGFVSTVTRIAGDTVQAAGSVISNVVGNIFGGSSSPSSAPAPEATFNDYGSLSSSPASSPLSSTGSVSAASIESPDVDCTPLLCKLKPAVTAACAAYGDGASLGTGSVTVTADNTSTNVAVAWNADSRVATFAWRGTQETQDWVQNLKLKFSTDTSSPYFQELYAGSKVYEGELNMFRAVTDQALNDSSSIQAQIDKMRNGVTPARIDCIGHSLGGGLATICGPWAAETWPTADVRVISFGSPKAGNDEFAGSVYATVGRIYRVVNSIDAVPSLPPFKSYVHANYALWLNNSQIILDERPPTDIGDLTWDAHGCVDQYSAAIQQSLNITIPEWVNSLS